MLLNSRGMTKAVIFTKRDHHGAVPLRQVVELVAVLDVLALRVQRQVSLHLG
jgi:hypothetical protein